MNKLKVGQSEFELLLHIAQFKDATVGQVAEHFAKTKGWVRTTVQRTMDRLLAKGLLSRHEENGVFRYRSRLDPQQLQGGLVDQFVTETLKGSFRPFVAYLSGGAHISDEELSELKALVDELDASRKRT